MTTVATLDTVLRLNSTAFRQGMVQAATQANQSLTSIQQQASETAKVLLSLKRAADGFGSFYLVKEGISSLIEAQVQLQSIQFTLQAATGSSTQATQAFGFVRNEADKLGLVLPTAAQGFANLSASATAAGVSMKDQQQLFDAYAKSASALHLSTDQSSRALLALEQMFAKGKIQAQELRLQLGQAIPGAAQRFQNAVLQMTKGTQLAGLSFEQLLEQGKLTTSQFLPALVTALQTSGRGWEEAADGLNANLNRVQTAWFNAKTEFSSGLFSDAVSLGAKALADNLHGVVIAAEAVAAAGISRILGGAGSRGLGGLVTFDQKNITGPRMAAAAEAEWTAAMAANSAEQARAAEASALANAVNLDAAQTSVARAKQLQFEALAIQEAAAAEVERTTTLLNTMKAEGGSSVEIASRNFQLAKQTAALEANARATQIMAAAQVEYDAAVAAATRFEAQQLLLRQQSIAAQGAEAVALKAATVAQAEMAVALNATTLAGKALKGLGNLALGLVGGPWGAAVLAIGGIAYAFYASAKASEEYRAETNNQVKSLKDLAAQANETAAAVGTLNATKNTTQTVQQVVTGGDQITKSQSELSDLRDQAERLSKTIAILSSQANSGAAIGFNQRQLDNVNDRIAKLSGALQIAQGAQDGLTQKMSLFGPAVDGVKAALDRLKAGASLGDIFNGLTDGFNKGLKDLDDAQAAVQTGISGLIAQGQSWQKAAAKDGKTASQQAAVDFAEIEKNIRKISPTIAAADAAVAAARAQAAIGFTGAKAKDDADAAKKAASAAEESAKRQIAAYNSAVKSVQDRIAADKESLSVGTQVTGAERDRAKLIADITSGTLKVTPAQRAYLVSLADTDVQLQKDIALQKQRAEGLSNIISLTEKLTAGLQDQLDQNAIDQIGVQHGEEVTRQLQGELEIRQKYQKEFDALNRQATKPENVGTTNGIGGDLYNTQLAEIVGFRDESVKVYKQGIDDLKAYQADASNGVRAAIEDFMTTQQNAAAQAKAFTSDLLSSGVTAFSSWIDGAQGAKKSFGDAIDTMRQKATEFVTSKIFQALIDSFSASGSKGLTAGSTQGGFGSLFGNIANAFGFGGASGSFAGGGNTNPGNFYRVNENGPELYKEDGRTWLMAGDRQGKVVPINPSVSHSRSTSIAVYVAPTTTRRTATQVASQTERTFRMANARNS